MCVQTVDVRPPQSVYPPSTSVWGDKRRVKSSCSSSPSSHTAPGASPMEAKTSSALPTGRSFLTTSIQQCAVVVRRLGVLEKLAHGEMAGFMLSLSLSVVELRLRLWAQIASGLFDDSALNRPSSAYPVQNMIGINGIICELDVVVNTLLRDTQPEVSDALYIYISLSSVMSFR